MWIYKFSLILARQSIDRHGAYSIDLDSFWI